MYKYCNYQSCVTSVHIRKLSSVDYGTDITLIVEPKNKKASSNILNATAFKMLEEICYELLFITNCEIITFFYPIRWLRLDTLELVSLYSYCITILSSAGIFRAAQTSGCILSPLWQDSKLPTIAWRWNSLSYESCSDRMPWDALDDQWPLL